MEWGKFILFTAKSASLPHFLSPLQISRQLGVHCFRKEAWAFGVKGIWNKTLQTEHFFNVSICVYCCS